MSVDAKFSLANRNHLGLVLAILIHIGGMCPKCGHGTRSTSKKWAVCKKCGNRCERKPSPEAAT
jgi:exosome complex RNA-binding protein Csl4